MLEDRDKAVRDESKQLAVELYRWVKDALRPLLQSLKPVQAAELEAEFAKVAGEAAVPERWLRSEQARRAQCTDAPEDGTDGGPDAAEGEAVPAVDAYELLEAVDVLSKLPKDFYEQLEAKKWQERKEALEKLLELAGLPKLEAGDYGDLVKALRRTVSKDSNVVVVALAARCLAGLALGLRQRFHPYAHSCVATCLDKLREKKPAVVAALREALDAAFAQSSLEAVLEELTGALEGKNPQVGVPMLRVEVRGGVEASAVLRASRSFSRRPHPHRPPRYVAGDASLTAVSPHPKRPSISAPRRVTSRGPVGRDRCPFCPTSLSGSRLALAAGTLRQRQHSRLFVLSAGTSSMNLQGCDVQRHKGRLLTLHVLPFGDHVMDATVRTPAGDSVQAPYPRRHTHRLNLWGTSASTFLDLSVDKHHGRAAFEIDSSPLPAQQLVWADSVPSIPGINVTAGNEGSFQTTLFLHEKQ